MELSITERSNTSRSKRGISVTLSKQKSLNNSIQKSNGKQQLTNSVKAQDNTFLQNAIQLFKGISPSKKNTKDQRTTTQQLNKSVNFDLKSVKQFQKNKQSNQRQVNDQKSIKSDYISTYFQKNSKKSQIQNESQRLDKQIRQLQLQIYNTRTKITHDKYLNVKGQLPNNKNYKSNNVNSLNNQLGLKDAHHERKFSINNNTQKQKSVFIKTVEKHYHSTKAPGYQQQKFKDEKFFTNINNNNQQQSPPHPNYLREMLKKDKHIPKSQPFNQSNHHFNTFQTAQANTQQQNLSFNQSYMTPQNQLHANSYTLKNKDNQYLGLYNVPIQNKQQISINQQNKIQENRNKSFKKKQSKQKSNKKVNKSLKPNSRPKISSTNNKILNISSFNKNRISSSEQKYIKQSEYQVKKPIIKNAVHKQKKTLSNRSKRQQPKISDFESQLSFYLKKQSQGSKLKIINNFNNAKLAKTHNCFYDNKIKKQSKSKNSTNINFYKKKILNQF